jgi:hypothetical protein
LKAAADILLNKISQEANELRVQHVSIIAVIVAYCEGESS